MDQLNIQTDTIQEKSYNGCLEALLVWWIIGGFLVLIWNTFQFFTEPYNSDGYIALSLLTISDIVSLWGLFQLTKYKAIGFYLTIGSNITNFVIASIWPQYLLLSNPQMRSILSIVLLIVLLLVKNKGKSGFQTLGILKDNNTNDNKELEGKNVNELDNNPVSKNNESIDISSAQIDNNNIDSETDTVHRVYVPLTNAEKNNTIHSAQNVKELPESIKVSVDEQDEQSKENDNIVSDIAEDGNGKDESVSEQNQIDNNRNIINPLDAEVNKKSSEIKVINNMVDQSTSKDNTDSKKNIVVQQESQISEDNSVANKGKRTKWWFLLGLIVIAMVSLICILLPKESSDEKHERFKTLYDDKKYEEALPIIQELFEADYTPAYRAYGDMLLHGYGTQMDINKAIETLEIAVSRNDLESILILAKYYKDQKDWSKSLDYYAKAENLGDTTNYDTMAWIYIEDKNPLFSIDQALRYANKALKQGNNDVMFTLGNIYSHDKKKDYDMAFYWWNKGTVDGSNNCKQLCWDNIGWVYLYGLGCKIDYSKAYEAFSKALSISPNDDYALSHIGEMYYYGQFVKKNDEMALSYLKKAADLGNEDAQKLYAEILRDKK